MATPKGFIFDMDDLLIRAGDNWNRAAQAVLRRHGLTWTPDLERHYKGMNCPDVAETMRRVLKTDTDPEAFRAEYRRQYMDEFPRNPEAMPGAVSLVRLLSEHRRPMVVASGSPLPVIERVTEALGIRRCFDHLISSESVARGKPHPDVFLAAAAALKLPPADCLVFEDSPAGVSAAIAAGIPCYCVPSLDRASVSHATRIFSSLADITPTDLGLQTSG